MKLMDYDVSITYEAQVVSNRRITSETSESDVRHIILHVPASAFRFAEGQSIGVLVPGPHAFGNETHMRLYSIANSQFGEDGDGASIAICVRRCFYIDEVSGERYPGVASNYLCDRQSGDRITIGGPYGQHFRMPRDPYANLLMIGTGTGIAPFRAFVKHIYATRAGWKGKVRLFYGVETGLDLLYMNDIVDDFTQYYDADTFRAFEAVSRRPLTGAAAALEVSIAEHGSEVWSILQNPRTYVYIAGLEKVREKLERALTAVAGSESAFEDVRDELHRQGRWAELLY